jgi:hypothetical protein
MTSRGALIADYDRLCRLLLKAGMEPTVSPGVLDVFTDVELGELIVDATQRLLRLRRFEA